VSESNLIEADGDTVSNCEFYVRRVSLDFERLNNNCQKPDGECMVDAIEARKVLRDALMLQTNLAKVRIELSNTPYYLNVWRTDAGAKRPQKVVQDHSFSRYLDYRDIGDYESH
jgi:hypothetical protein